MNYEPTPSHERTKPPFSEPSIIPAKYGWSTLLDKRGTDLSAHYEKILKELPKEGGLLGLIYSGAENKIKNEANLERIIRGIDDESWMRQDVDVKGEIYEGLLEKHAAEARGGAGQYFTPRVLIAAMVETTDPQPGETIYDPACGTGGFFLGARKHVIDRHGPLDRTQRNKLKSATFYGVDIAEDVVRLCAMNMYLHGLATSKEQIERGNSLARQSGRQFDVILTNPPFGSAKDRAYERDDFWAADTRDKHLNFLQHVYSSLKVGGRCAIVLPDGVLFGGTNAHRIIRKKLLELCDVHTILRLPTGIFYATGVNTNVLFFTKRPHLEGGRPATQKTWFYDLRTDNKVSLKENKMERRHLDDFVRCYTAKRRKESERFREFTFEEMEKKDSWTWLMDTNDVVELPDMHTLMKDIAVQMTLINKAVKALEKETASAGQK